MDKFLTYEEVSALKKGDRIQVRVDGKFVSGTITGIGTLLTVASIWVEFDNDKLGVSTNIITGISTSKEFWQQTGLPYKFKEAPLLFYIKG